uniref:Uncharacterized protein n=1 Tax=Trichobilharzia regenti TaxID=157069 RepID=A0AA85J628_TRIRE
YQNNCGPFHSICRISHAGVDHCHQMSQLVLRCSFQCYRCDIDRPVVTDFSFRARFVFRHIKCCFPYIK